MVEQARRRREALRANDGPAQNSLNGKRIGILTTSISHLGGGVAEAVLAQAEVIRTIGAVPVILALDDPYVGDVLSRLAGVEVHFASRRGPDLFGFAPSLLAKLDAARLDCLHLHGIWQYPSRAAHIWARQTGRPYLISPHGMLDPWITERGRWKKALARAGYERSSWRSASRFHALTNREAADIARETNGAAISVIPNPAPLITEVSRESRSPNLLYLGRIHRKKNLDSLTAAWSTLASEGRLPAGATLTLAGWGEPQDVAALAARAAAGPASIAFVGPSFGTDKAARLGDARFMILPSLSEGLPMAVLEAWAAGTPTLMSSECNLPQGFATGAALDCGTSRESIATTLTAALALPDRQWQAMSQAAMDLARGPFSAETVMDAWRGCYGKLLANHGGLAA